MGAITSIGFLVSPAVGGVLADRFGIRLVLVAAFALFLLSMLLVLRIGLDGPGTVPTGGAPLARTDLRPLGPALTVYVGVHAAIMITVPFLAPYLREVRGISLAEIGLLNSMTAVGAVVLSPLVGRTADRLGLAPVLAGQLGVFALGVVMTLYGPAAALPVMATLRCRAPLNALVQAMVGTRTPAAVLGRVFSIGGVLSAGLAAVGSFAGGYAYRANPAYPLLISAALAVTIGLMLGAMHLHAAARRAAPARP
jgi:MFS family permease